MTTNNKVQVSDAKVAEHKENMFKMMEGVIKEGKKVTLSDQMRFLQSEGLGVSEIAKVVGKPYRQVYSTLNHHKYIGGVMERKAATQAKKDQEMIDLANKVKELEAKLSKRAAKRAAK